MSSKDDALGQRNESSAFKMSSKDDVPGQRNESSALIEFKSWKNPR